jgi:hypothetical protein
MTSEHGRTAAEGDEVADVVALGSGTGLAAAFSA